MIRGRNTRTVEPFDFSNISVEELRWLVKDLIPLGHLCFLLAQSGSGKSFLLEGLALHVAAGIKFCDMDTAEGDVLIIDQDTPTDVLQTRLKRTADGLGIKPVHNVYVESMAGYSLVGSCIPDAINYYNPVLVILDSLHSICGKLNPNSSDMNVWAKIKAKCLTRDRTIITAHHLTEKITLSLEQLMDQEIHLSGMGNSAIKQQADSEYILASTVEDGKIDCIYLRPIAKRQAIPQTPYIIKMSENGSGIKFEGNGYYNPDISEIESDVLLLFEETHEEYMVSEIRSKMGNKWGEKPLRTALKALEGRGRLVMRRNRSNLFRYRLP